MRIPGENMTFRTLLVVTALLAPMAAVAADPVDNGGEPDLSIAVKVGKSTTVIIQGAQATQAVNGEIAEIVRGETNQVLVVGIAEGETSALIPRKGEKPFRLAVRVTK
jgi:hypothetical protein